MPTSKKAAAVKPAAKPSRKPEKEKPHYPSLCTVCGYPRAWTGYATRSIELKDGSPAVAKWPTYEACPNLLDPEKHPAYRRTAAAWVPVQAVLTIPDLGVTGLLGQLPRGGTLGEAWPELLACFQARLGEGQLPKRVLVSPAELADRQAEADLPPKLRLQSDKILTPGYHYVLLVA